MRRKVTSRLLIMVAILCVWAFVWEKSDAAAAKEPDYPTKPISYYISYQAGGATDIMVRALVEPAGKILGQPFVVINKPGGGSLLGAVAVRNSKPDAVARTARVKHSPGGRPSHAFIFMHLRVAGQTQVLLPP